MVGCRSSNKIVRVLSLLPPCPIHLSPPFSLLSSPHATALFGEWLCPIYLLSAWISVLLDWSHAFFPCLERESDTLPPHPHMKIMMGHQLPSFPTHRHACPENRDRFPPLPEVYGEADFSSNLSEDHLCLCRDCHSDTHIFLVIYLMSDKVAFSEGSDF